jgi:small subunit ribosomal protein S16
LAVKLRLRRMGKKKQPIYKVVAADSRAPRDGKFLEAIGLYNPLTDPHTLNINEDRAMYWLNVGAQPTDTVKSLLRQKGIILKRELVRKGLSEDKIATELENWEKLSEAKANSASKKKKSRKAEAKEKAEAEAKLKAEAEAKKNAEADVEAKEKEQVVSEEKVKEEKTEDSTAEVKGATSDENAAEKE